MTLDGRTFSQMCISAANALDRNKTAINNLNVFPVPDGDTGVNMYLTMSTVKELMDFDGSISECADKIASMLLRNARGNSGAILSLFFRGFSRSMKGLRAATASDVANAFVRGTGEAYKAVMNPTEGTILTVMRICAERAVKDAETQFKDDLAGMFSHLVDTASQTLKRTPEMLPILKQANVVDAGGKGFLTVLEGMQAALKGDPVLVAREIVAQTMDQADFSDFSTEDIRFSYCTEIIVGKSEEYRGEDKAEEMKDFLAGIGDSVVFAEDEEIFKVHVHTNRPGLVLEEGVKYGRLEKVKVENMRMQHTALMDISVPFVEKAAPAPEGDREPYGFVSVCMGNGIEDTFRDLGVTALVSGGQTMNPSTQNLLDAIDSVNAQTVFVLPNNKNIHLVAQQAAEMTTGKTVIVLPTRTIPQGISAMIAFNPDLTPGANREAMSEAMETVKTVSITGAVRDSEIDGIAIREGQSLGLLDGKIVASEDSAAAVVGAMHEVLASGSYITLYVGADADPAETENISLILQQTAPGAEVMVIDGGQPVYPYLIAVENLD